MDHFFQIEVVGEVEEPMLEGHCALSYLAAVTEKAMLGTLVTGVHYRYLGLLDKTESTLDVLSGAGLTSGSARAGTSVSRGGSVCLFHLPESASSG